MEVVAERYVKWQEPEVEAEPEEEETAEPQLLARRPKHRISTSSESDSVKSGVSEVEVAGNGDMKAENGKEGGEIVEDLKLEEAAVVEEVEELVKAGEVAGVELSGENVYFDKASGAQFRNTEVSVAEDGAVIQSSEVIDQSVTLQEIHTICKTQIMPIKDAETEPVYHSLESVQADGSYHLTLDSTSGNGDVTTRNHNEKGHHIQNYSSEELGVIYEGDPEPIDYDVEGVLKKQETHDLICPNCNCCITRGVRLKKRKRVPKDTHPSAKRDRIEEDTGTVDGALGERLTIRGEDTASDLQVITCWSCFSLLIPTGKGFRLFRLFGGRKQPEPEVISQSHSIQTPLPTPGGGRILMDQSSTVNPLQLADGNMEGQKTDINPATKKKDDVRILIEYEVKQIDPRGTEEITRDIGIPITGTQAPVREPVVRDGEARDWDILKSIVYGGLIESITSLGVVASAAGAETATLNIVVLGLANLIGGLILIFHNLKDLRKSAYEEPSNQVDRYHEVLGRRSNFKLHAVIVVLSFLIFGLIPIATYAFTFRKSDNRDYKSLAVIGASLISVTLLSLGKAHTKNPPRPASSYFKSISYYLTIAISASGLSYVAGKLLNELIEKTGWFDTTSSLNSISFPATVMPSQLAWGSY